MAKMTKAQAFAELLVLVKGNEELTQFVEHELELLANRKSSKGLSQKVLTEREELREKVLQVLVEVGSGLTVTEILGQLNEVGLSTSLVTSRLGELVKLNKVEQFKVGRKSLYKAI